MRNINLMLILIRFQQRNPKNQALKSQGQSQDLKKIQSLKRVKKKSQLSPVKVIQIFKSI